MDAAKTVTANFEMATFEDVPFDHPMHDYIESLWDNGYTSGCSLTAVRFCPDNIMTRAESAVFMLRGNFGADYEPPVAPWNTFSDDWTLGDWAEAWAEGMWEEGMTAGCQYPPDNPDKKFCPWDQFTREQGSVFGLRMENGMDFTPPAAEYIFADMTEADEFWSTPWAEAAYDHELLPACGEEDGKPLFCPTQPLTRGWGAYLVVKSKGLPLP